jgi:hypothetical protein
VFFLGGLIYAPFTPVAYTFVQSVLSTDEQQPVLTLWPAGAALAAPVGPLVQGVGVTGDLVVSALLTIALVPPAGVGLLRRRAVLPDQTEATWARCSARCRSRAARLRRLLRTWTTTMITAAATITRFTSTAGIHRTRPSRST